MLKKDKQGSIKNTIDNKKKLKKKAWDTFSIWIRTRDRKCVTCGFTCWDENIGEWGIKGLQGGHFHHTVLDFDEMNINAQCSRCNKYLSGNLSKYSVYLIEKYGTDKFLNLSVRASNAFKGELLDIEDYKRIIEKYKI